MLGDVSSQGVGRPPPPPKHSTGAGQAGDILGTILEVLHIITVLVLPGINSYFDLHLS